MKIGLLTSGGDCQGLNAALRGVAKTLYKAKGTDVELYGISDGYRGLMEGEWRRMLPQDFSGILRSGGTILGTSRQPFKRMQDPDLQDPRGRTRLEKMLENFRASGMDALVILGGNGTHKTARLLSDSGVPVVTLPKTIDNDIWGTDATFGFDSAVNKAAGVLDALHTTAASHGRVFVAELMGHKVGWVALHAGIAGGADVILLPEIPYDPDEVARAVQARESFAIIAAAEGALSVKEAQLPKKERKALLDGGGAGKRLADALAGRLGREVRVTVPGHYQRGGDPTPADRLLCCRMGAAAGELLLQGKYGCMTALQGTRIVPVPLAEVAGRLKTVPEDSETIGQARLLGISLGD